MPMMTAGAVTAIREQLDLSDGFVWMQHAGGARFPRCAAEAVASAAAAQHASQGWPERYVDDRDAVKTLLARLVGGSAEHVVLVRSTGHGLSLVSRGLDWRPGDNVVTARWEFPSNLVPWLSLEPYGVEVRRLDPPDGRVTPELVLEHVDHRTRVVALSHVQFWNGYRADIETLGRQLHDAGVLFVVDSIQATGAIPTDVESSYVDVLACGAIKWLMGPVGLGFAHLSDRALDALMPITLGTGSLAQPERSFDPVFELATGARRFEESATSWFDLVALRASLELIETATVEAIHRRVTDITLRIGTELAARGHEIVAPWPRSRDESSAIISFRTPGIDAEAQFQHLYSAQVMARHHHDFVRLSPHAYLTDDEVERALAAVRDPD